MIRVPGRFNSTFISRHFFPAYFKTNNLRDINSGRCYDWSYIAYRLFGAKLWTTDYHAWVQVGKRFYDSETKNGVLNFMELKCNIRQSYPMPWDDQAPTQMNVIRFKDFWNKYGGGDRYHWESKLEVALKNVLGDKYKDMTPIFPDKFTIN